MSSDSSIQVAWRQDFAFLGLTLAVNGARVLLFNDNKKSGITALACGVFLIIGSLYSIKAEEISGRVTEGEKLPIKVFKF